MHCNAEGHLVHVDLSSTNMECFLNDLMAPLAALNTVQSLFADDNVLRGLLNGDEIMQSGANWTALTLLSLQQVRHLQGSIPFDCAPPFRQLGHVLVTGTQISGVLPPCLIQTAQTIQAARTRLTGTLPSLEGSLLRCAVVVLHFSLSDNVCRVKSIRLGYIL
jgi:hypothetical protein